VSPAGRRIATAVRMSSSRIGMSPWASRVSEDRRVRQETRAGAASEDDRSHLNYMLRRDRSRETSKARSTRERAPFNQYRQSMSC